MSETAKPIDARTDAATGDAPQGPHAPGMKRPVVAYALWLIFLPLGIYGFYLRAWPRALAFIVATAFAAWLVRASPAAGVAVFVAVFAAALYDLRWIARRIEALNRRAQLEKFQPGARVARD